MLYGLTLTVSVAALATYLGRLWPIVGGPIFGILLGLVIRLTGRIDARFQPGIRFSSKRLLQTSVILLGTGLSLGEVFATGSRSLLVTISTLAVCLVTAWALGRWLKISSDLTTLVGVGTSICGASAIAAVSPVIEAEENDVAYALSTIFLFNIAAALIFPPLGRLLGLSQEAFGIWAGTAINDTSSVVAAAYTYGAEAGQIATVVKLTRSLFILPIVFGLAAWRARGKATKGRVDVVRIFPWFIVGFLLAALIRSLSLLPLHVLDAANQLGRFFMVVALVGVGLSVDLKQMRQTGLKPLYLGLALWAAVAVSSLIVQSLL